MLPLGLLRFRWAAVLRLPTNHGNVRTKLNQSRPGTLPPLRLPLTAARGEWLWTFSAAARDEGNLPAARGRPASIFKGCVDKRAVLPSTLSYTTARGALAMRESTMPYSSSSHTIKSDAHSTTTAPFGAGFRVGIDCSTIR